VATGSVEPDDDSFVIRTYRPADYDAVVALWRSVGFHVDERESRAALEYKLRRDEGPFLVVESDGAVIGTALGRWDGRRAWVHRVAVAPGRQSKGLGTRLMAEVESRLRELGARSAALLVNRERAEVVRLYRRLGYEIEEGVAFMRKMLAPEEVSADGP